MRGESCGEAGGGRGGWGLSNLEHTDTNDLYSWRGTSNNKLQKSSVRSDRMQLEMRMQSSVAAAAAKDGSCVCVGEFE